MRKVDFLPGGNQNITLIRAKYDSFAFKAHYHLDYHVGLISDGNQLFNYKGTKHHVGPDYIQIMMPGEVHDGQTLKGQGFSTQIFSLSSDWFKNVLCDRQSDEEFPFLIHCVKDKELYHQLTFLHNQLQTANTCQLALDSYPIEVISELVERYGKVKTVRPSKIGTYQIRELRDYLMAHLADKIHLSQLAEICELTESKLLRYFKHTIGMTPYAWLYRLRLEQAMTLLRAGQASTEVGYQVGFYDQAHFIKAFKTGYGITPSQVLKPIKYTARC